MVFYRRHVCRLDPWPEPLVRAGARHLGALAHLEEPDRSVAALGAFLSRHERAIHARRSFPITT